MFIVFMTEILLYIIIQNSRFYCEKVKNYELAKILHIKVSYKYLFDDLLLIRNFLKEN